MRDIKIKINLNKVNDKGFPVESSESANIELPFKCWRTSDMSGFSMKSNGIGEYFGPSQMFGGPSTGDIVFYNNVKPGKSYFAIITNQKQDWDTRTCTVKVLCWDTEMKPRILKGLKNAFIENTVTEKDLMEHSIKYLGFEKAVDLCILASKERLKLFINNL